MNSKLKITLLLFLFSIVYCLLSNSVFAETKASNSISVLPQLTQLDLGVSEPETKIYYTNNTPYPVELGLSVEDVRELEERNPVGLLNPKEAANYKYSLSSWVYLDKQTLLLNPGETGAIKVTVTREKLSPGGHYGSILAEIKQKTDDKKIKIKGVLVSLLFVRASTGNEIEEAKVSSLNVTQTGINFPQKAVMRFQNTGNVDLTPYGLIEIKDRRGKLVAKGIVNEDSLITLPEAIRQYDIPLKSLIKYIPPGKYSAVLNIHFGKSDKKLTSTVSFTTQGSADVIKWSILLLIGAGVILGVMRYIKSKTHRP